MNIKNLCLFSWLDKKVLQSLGTVMYTYLNGAGEAYLDNNGDFTINVGGVNVPIDEEANSAKVMYFTLKVFTPNSTHISFIKF